MPSRPRHDQRPRPVADIERIDQEPGQPAEMIAMQMGDEHGVDFVRLQARAGACRSARSRRNR